MTEPDLINALTNASVDARAVLAMIAQLAGANTTVSVTLSSGQTFVLPGVPYLQAQFAADRASDKLGFTKDFAPGAMQRVYTRDPVTKRLTQVVLTRNDGWTITEVYARNASTQRITGVTITLKDATATVQATFSRTVTYDSSGSYTQSIQ
jgi:hypothetical protein